MNRDIHPLMVWNDTGLPLLAGDFARVLILGSYPGVRSCRVQEYYAHPRNRFWKIMEGLFGIDANLSYACRTQLLVSHGVALWDVIRACDRSGSDDNSIRYAEANDIGAALRTYPSIGFIALNGSIANRCFTKFYGKFPGAGAVVIAALPSTSPANTKYSPGDLLLSWGEVREQAQGESRDESGGRSKKAIFRSTHG